MKINLKILFLSLALLLYIFLIIYMYISKDANFTIYFNIFKLLALVIMLLTTILLCLKNRSLCVIILILLFVCDFGIKRIVFGESLEKFLFIKNRKEYLEATDWIIKEKIIGYADLNGVYRKLSRGMTVVVRDGKDIQIYYGIFSSLASRGQIVYSNNMTSTVKENGVYYRKYEVIDKNWMILYY